MAKKPVDFNKVIKLLTKHNLQHLNSGKTRELFDISMYDNLLFIFATDRISIFDIKLPMLVARKGEALTALIVLWLTKILPKTLPNLESHLVAYSSGIDYYLPEGLRNNTILQKCCIVVQKTEVIPVEAIVRGHITGSYWEEYEKGERNICGFSFPDGLKDGSPLPEPIFTPSTKAKKDINISYEEMEKRVGRKIASIIKKCSLSIFKAASEFAALLEIILADSKFEFGCLPDGKIILIDEVITSDSSRLWLARELEAAIRENRKPPSLDKQPLRDAGKRLGIKENPDVQIPQKFFEETTLRYLDAFQALGEKPIELFQKEDMGIAI
jgi:phosphoribosylaminoimidazole-succinocarboxamide synthase